MAWTRARTFKKADPVPLEKADPTPKFTVLVKNLFLRNLRVLISNITIVFLKVQPNNTKTRQFWSKILGFFYSFHELFHLIDSRVLMSNMTIVLKIAAQKKLTHFWSQV